MYLKLVKEVVTSLKSQPVFGDVAKNIVATLAPPIFEVRMLDGCSKEAQKFLHEILMGVPASFLGQIVASRPPTASIIFIFIKSESVELELKKELLEHLSEFPHYFYAFVLPCAEILPETFTPLVLVSDYRINQMKRILPGTDLAEGSVPAAFYTMRPGLARLSLDIPEDVVTVTE